MDKGVCVMHVTLCKINKNGAWDKEEQKVMTKNQILVFYQ
jgi:hypothetical protein